MHCKYLCSSALLRLENIAFINWTPVCLQPMQVLEQSNFAQTQFVKELLLVLITKTKQQLKKTW